MKAWGNAMCPEKPEIEYKGDIGTNLFITPKINYLSNQTEYAKYDSNVIQFMQAS